MDLKILTMDLQRIIVAIGISDLEAGKVLYYPPLSRGPLFQCPASKVFLASLE